MIEIPAGSASAAGRGAPGCSGSGGWIFLVFGLVFGGIGLGMSVPCWRASGWPTAPGVVTKSELLSHRGSKGGTTRRLHVFYTFTVNGVTREGDRLDAIPISTSGDGPFQDQREYGAGTPVQVHYNPGDPGENCIRTSLGPVQWIMNGIGVLMAMIAVAVLYGTWWKRNSPQGF